MTDDWDLGVDVLIAGSGAAALAGALTASRAGLVPLVVERSGQWGGTTALSGGAVWAPTNPFIDDSVDDAIAYLDALVGEPSRFSSAAKRRAFVTAVPEFVAALGAAGFEWSHAADYPDYHGDLPGARTGRTIESAPFDLGRLGPWRETLRSRDVAPEVPIKIVEIAKVLHAVRTRDGAATAARVGARTLKGKLAGRHMTSMGMAIAAQLMYLVNQRGIGVWLNAPMRELIVEDGRVCGAIIERDGRAQRIRANRGVLLGLGGYAANDELRRSHGNPSDSRWSLSIDEDRGDALSLCDGLGADTALMDDAWWVPAMFPPGAAPSFVVWERTLPHSIMVGPEGNRFANEAESYQDLCRRMFALGAVPSWLVIDSNHRRRYALGNAPQRLLPRRWLKEGFVVKAGSLDELASSCGMDPQSLRATVERFNGFAASGVDADFKRGETPNDRWYSDPTHGPNPSLGAIERAPFYAVRLYPADVGTKGGLVTDEHARVLREDGTHVEGLYAAGNSAASFMGNRYPGPGATIGAAMVFGFVAMRHAAASVVEIYAS